MSNSKLEDYNKKLRLLEKHNKYYYQNQKPLISDKEYDDLKKKILEIEKKFGFTNLKSPSFKVGYKPSKNLKNLNIKSECCHYQMLLIGKI